MRRRQVLAGLAGLLAGCGGLGRDISSDASGVTPAPVPAVDGDTGERRRWFRGQPCPRFDEGTDQTVCSQTDSTSDTLTFRPDRPVVRASDGTPVEPLRITLVWRARRPLTVLASDWYHVRRTEDGWTRVAAGTGDTPATELDGTGRLHWVVGDSAPRRNDGEPVTTTLTPGRHALVVQTVSSDLPLHTECVALFDVVSA
ncbi:hypothetical protein ACFQL1_04510 [Halomicroarcula sp. GCM10025709]|uniref:hypothetical protein n=1 Tax=Haloarcula TaxID=2237 RepID=UPI0024C25083|nr:hypothetical protein [Halomicroarcula sp. YJ-61-S]